MKDLLNQPLAEGDFIVLPSKGNFKLEIAMIISFNFSQMRVIWKSSSLKDPTTALLYPEYSVKVDKTIIGSEIIERLTSAAKMLL